MNGMCWTKVTNVTNEDLILYKNTLICNVEEPHLSNDTQHGKYKGVKLARDRTEEFEAKLEEKLSHLDNEEKIKIRNILCKFSDIFSLGGIENLGCTSTVEHKINTGDHPPINKRPYRVPHSQRDVLKKLIQEQLDKGIIVTSTSTWSAPVVIVPKKPGPDGVVTYRMCIDFREINKITVPEVWPLPDIHETLDSLGGSKYFTALDMNSGFFQIKMHPEIKRKPPLVLPMDIMNIQDCQWDLLTRQQCFRGL
ncbi:hypothetical protein LSTR_LSTR014039 [Laodelphax striatellus]|uniref:Reverse transcriptase domain-containing protein n=1 Tax=Laodelphax striatellus TaxID=195883 RepID=A0A482X579_LAOST|nr:hypothetical protein LSTR_LSTR014039 [Laodelphax striatellus]